MRKFELGLAVVAICSVFASCTNNTVPYNGNDNVHITALNSFSQEIFDNGLTMGNTICNAEIDFNSNRDWAATTAEIQNRGKQWCHLTPNQGKPGNTQFTISADANTTNYERNVILTLKADTLTKRILITQKRENSLLITKERYDFNTNGGHFYAQIKPHINCKVTIADDCKDWIKQSADPENTNKIDFTIAKTDKKTERQGLIFFTNGTYNDTIRVNQNNAPLIVSGKVLNIAENAKVIKVDLNTNCNYSVQMPKVRWIHDCPSGMSSHTLLYSIDKNDEYSNRSTQIVFTNLINNTKDTLSINQYQHGALIIKTKKFDITKAGGQITVDVQSNENFEYTVPKDYSSWINATTNLHQLKDGLVDHTIKFDIKANTGDKRKGFILFRKKGDANYTDTVTVNQELGNPQLNIKTKTFHVSQNGEQIAVDVQSNVDFEYTCPDTDASWISANTTNRNFVGGMTDHIVKFDIKANNGDNRSGKILFRIKGLDKYSDTVTVNEDYSTTFQVDLKDAAGSLSKYLSDHYKYKIQNLIVAGNINGDDMIAIRDLCGKDAKDNDTQGKLESLNIKNATIVDGGASYISNGHTVAPEENSIGAYSFFGTKIQKIILPDNLSQIGQSCFETSDLSSVTFPEKQTLDLGIHCFAECPNLKKITIPANVEGGNIGVYDCVNLTDVTFMAEEVASFMFKASESLKNVTLSDNVKEIMTGAFTQCPALTEIKIPKNLKRIDAKAFADTPISLIDCSETNQVPQLNKTGFDPNPNAKIYVKSALIDQYKSDPVWSKIFNDNQFIAK